MRLISIKIGVFLFVTGLSLSAYGARFPNAVEKKILLTGHAAISIAKLFGLSTSGPSSFSLQLGRSDAWAVYLLKQDTKEELWNDNNGSPPRYNTVEFSTSPVFSLTISPYWLDLGTQLPDKKVGYYSFKSPFIPERFDLNDPWTQLLRRLMRESGWSITARRQFQRCFTSLEGIELCVEVFGAKDYTNNVEKKGHCIVIEANIKAEFKRDKVEK